MNWDSSCYCHLTFPSHFPLLSRALKNIKYHKIITILNQVSRKMYANLQSAQIFPNMMFHLHLRASEGFLGSDRENSVTLFTVERNIHILKNVGNLRFLVTVDFHCLQEKKTLKISSFMFHKRKPYRFGATCGWINLHENKYQIQNCSSKQLKLN